jgi:hypothetical protein
MTDTTTNVLKRAVATADWDQQRSMSDLMAEARLALDRWKLERAINDALVEAKAKAMRLAQLTGP